MVSLNLSFLSMFFNLLQAILHKKICTLEWSCTTRTLLRISKEWGRLRFLSLPQRSGRRNWGPLWPFQRDLNILPSTKIGSCEESLRLCEEMIVLEEQNIPSFAILGEVIFRFKPLFVKKFILYQTFQWMLFAYIMKYRTFALWDCRVYFLKPPSHNISVVVLQNDSILTCWYPS